MFVFSSCGSEDSNNRQSGIFGMIKGSSDEAPGAARKLDGQQTVYPLTRTVVEYHKSTEEAFKDDDPPRLAILARQLPDEPKGEILVRVSVYPSNPGHNVIYSGYPVRVGSDAHIHIYENPSTYPAMWLTRDDVWKTVIYRTDKLGVFTFRAKSRLRDKKNGYITLDVGGTTYKVALIDS